MGEAERFCFLDVDGVVADLCGALAHVHGVPIEAWPQGEYDLTKILGKTAAQVWEHPRVRGDAFWYALDLLPWARELVVLADATFGRDRVAFLTQPVRDPACVAGKAAWFSEHFPGRAWFVGPRKAVLARPNAVLIDDHDGNCDAWQHGGGEAVLFPARWNRMHAHADDPMPHVRSHMALTGANSSGETERRGIQRRDDLESRAYWARIDDAARTTSETAARVAASADLVEDRKLIRRVDQHGVRLSTFEAQFIEDAARQFERGKPLTEAQRQLARRIDEQRVR